MATQLHFVVQLVMWYFFSIVFNVEVKRLFIEYRIPWTISLMNFVVACLGCAAIMGRKKETLVVNGHPLSQTIPYQKLIAIGLLQFLGNFATNISIQAMSVSFTHVVKATEVIFVLAWSYVLVYFGLPNRTTTTVSQFILILVITFGVIIASMKETTFSWQGFTFGILSNIGFSGRNTLSKWVMTNHNVSKEFVFVVASFISCIPCLLPVLFIEWPILTSMPISSFMMLFYTSVMFFLYNTVSFTVLEGVTTVTHAIANCCKRLVIIAVSLLVFRTVIQPLNLVGSLIAIFGVALYTQLGSGSLAAILRKNLTLMIVGSVLVTAALYSPPNMSTGSGIDFHSKSCPPPIECDPCPVAYPPALMPPYTLPKKGNSDMIADLQTEILRVLGPHFSRFRKAVIIDVPDHSNKGDSAIFTGEREFLQQINVRLIYSCADEHKFACNIDYIEEIADPSDTIICLHGGGNWGDLWLYFADLRNKWVRELSKNNNYTFLMFPQTITYTDMKNLKPTKDLFNSLEDVILVVRDKPSEVFLKEHFPTKTLVYSPDMAWMNGHKPIAQNPKYDVLFFLRTDHEGEKMDEKVNTLVKTYRPGLKYFIDDWVKTDVEISNFPLEQLAADRFYAGLNFIARAKVVVTNRLHGHILSVLSDKPHVILDNIYGKVFNAHYAWTMNATNVEVASNIEEAVTKAIALFDAQTN